MIGGNGQLMGSPMPQTQAAGGMPQPYQQTQQGAFNPFATAFAPHQQGGNPYAGILAPLMNAQAGTQTGAAAPMPATMSALSTGGAQPYTAQSIAALIASLNQGSGTAPSYQTYQQPAAVTAALNAPLAAAAAAAAGTPAPATGAAPEMNQMAEGGAERAGGLERENHESGHESGGD